MLGVLSRLQYSQTENNFCRPATNPISRRTPFQQILLSEGSSVSTVRFSPIIAQPLASKDVVYTAMNYCQFKSCHSVKT